MDLHYWFHAYIYTALGCAVAVYSSSFEYDCREEKAGMETRDALLYTFGWPIALAMCIGSLILLIYESYRRKDV
jgi:hypothetical protein